MPKSLILKYRPQKISELDHRPAREVLLKTFAGGKIPHAFLFSGPKGIGKTSAARIVAKAVNCEEVQRCRGAEVQKKKNEPLNLSRKATDEPLNLCPFEPCNECPTCISITNGTNLDVLEIDGASNTGIDDIRDLRDKVRLAPTLAKYKVYIIDEVHMLSNAAFNGLLKTLEEPPEHVIFILCTTQPEKLPETIISRCTRINFKKATKEEIVEKLEKISKEENFIFKKEDLEKIAKAAGGSFRDANKILEQAMATSVDEILETFGSAKPSGLLELMISGKTKEAIIWVGNLVDQGANLKILIEEVLEILRESLLAKYGVEVEGTETEVLDKLGIEDLKKLIDLFSQAAGDLRNAVIPQLPLELAVIEWDKIKNLRGDDGEQKTDVEDKRQKDEEQSKSQKIPLLSKAESRTSLSSAVGPPCSPRGEAGSEAGHLSSIKLEEILTKWPEVLAQVKPLNHSIQAFLKASRPVAIEEDFLILEVFYKFHKDQLESDRCRKLVEQVCGQVLAAPFKLKFILGEKPQKTPAPSVNKIQEVEGVTAQVKELPSGDDLVKLAEEIFNSEKGIIH